MRVLVSFDPRVPDDAQAKAMFELEKLLRTMTTADVRVFKERMADDSSLRRVMDMRRKK